MWEFVTWLFLSAADELHRVLQPFLLRRVKAEVAAELPKKTELVVFHGLSSLQKRYYKAILMRDLGKTALNHFTTGKIEYFSNKRMSVHYTVLIISDAFRTDQSTKTRLLNVLMQLRKCVDHPYLFDGNHSITFCDFSIHIHFNQQQCKSIFLLVTLYNI